MKSPRAAGDPACRVHVLPYPLNEQERDAVKAIGEAHFDAMLDDFGAVLEMRPEMQVAAE